MRKTIVVACGIVLAAAPVLFAQGFKTIRERLTGFQETPLALSTSGKGVFHARISNNETMIAYELSYRDLESDVTQAHIHFGETGQTGGVSAFLCTNVGGPAGTQACPPAPATISGVIDAADVIGPAGQGIAAGELDELIRAIRAGSAYVNVHTTGYPFGEIRADFGGHGGHGNDDDDD